MASSDDGLALQLAEAEQAERSGASKRARELLLACVDACPPGHGQRRPSLLQLTLGELFVNGSESVDDLAAAEQHYRAALDLARAATSDDDGDEEKSGSPAAACLESLAFERLLLLLCQEGRDDEAKSLLLANGYTHRLSSAVLRYAVDDESTRGNDDSRKLVRSCDDALAPEMLARLQQLFAVDSPFWRQHNYSASAVSPSPYFSFCHALDAGCRTLLDQVIAHVQRVVAPLFPAVAEARYAEWWAHCRPHHSGHQMHFDSDDEGRDGVRNPIVSTVVYLTDGVGGPTLVTNQGLASRRLASCGWSVFPKVNRLTVFDGTYLHGVVPGRGVSPPAADKRITLMIAFWKQLHVRHHPSGVFGASMQPIDPAVAWLPPPLSPDQYQSVVDSSPLRPEVMPAKVAPVWSRLEGSPTAPLGMPAYDLCFQGF